MNSIRRNFPAILLLALATLCFNVQPVRALVENQMFGIFGVDPVVHQPSGANQAAVGAVTGYATSATIKQFVVSGSNGAGPVTLTGAPLGATVVGVVNLSSPALASSSFEVTLSVAGQIQQTSVSNLSGNTYLVTIASNSTTDIGAVQTLANAIRGVCVSLGFMKGGA